MTFLTEADIEQALLAELHTLGYQTTTEAKAGPDGSAPEREAYSDVLLLRRLQAAIDRLNPDLPAEARADALRQVLATVAPSLIEENRRLYDLMTEGVKVEYYAQDGSLSGGCVQLIDFNEVENNDWLAIGQFTVIEAGHKRRADVVLFINGLPLVVIELKSPSSEQATLQTAYTQLQTYKAEIPSLFRTNVALVISDGQMARIGSLTADTERFMRWRTVDGETIAPDGTPEQPVLAQGALAPERLLALLQGFTVFGRTDAGPVKILAGYHQFHGVRRAVASTLRALAMTRDAPPEPPQSQPRPQLPPTLKEDPEDYGLPSVKDYQRGDRRIGVIWHTQGSGKSLLMAFYVGQLVRHPAMANPTIVVITDRNDLDDQLFATFVMCQDLIRQTPQQATSRVDLRAALQRASGGVIFTTIQKFAPECGPDGSQRQLESLSDRRNIVVIADEAHRSQYGLNAKVDSKTGAIGYGFAKHLRDALPNASFIGFTGTPIEAEDVNTPALFGGYIDIYDISRAVEDGATVPIYYESRLARIELPEDKKPELDAEIDELTDDADDNRVEDSLKRKWSRIEALVGAEDRVNRIAADIVEHLERRLEALDGKAMIVCMSRRICVAMYQAIVALRPDWHSDAEDQGAIKIVMTGSASDPEHWQRYIGNKAERKRLATRAKNPNDPLKLVIVRDMWLTGFDAPSLHTLYVDKPMRGHGLMQAIARVNRVFRDKPAGLVVDYIGIAQRLKEALGQYSRSDQERTGIDTAEAVAVMLEKFEIVQAMFHGFGSHGLDDRAALTGTPSERLALMGQAIEWILSQQQAAAARERDETAKKRAHRRYQDAVLQLSKAYALASASEEAKAIRDEVGFFQAIRAALVKSSTGGGHSSAERDAAIAQLIDRSVVSTEIVDILGAAGISSPDISILSDEFLAEIAQTKQKNLALEALRKLLNDQVRSRSRSNVSESRRFSERLEDAIARYHTNAISTVEVLQELIEIAKELRTAQARGEEEGLSEDELAFYDALAENQSAVEVMGNDQLKVIAHELLVQLQGNVTVDWAHRENARAKMRVLVKRILRKYGYPPDLQAAAVQTVLAQAEVWSAGWVR
ncbi:type I restriction endonuclease subunit R [Lamprobacter modestohalophilus]|uniref:type I restriction endonuclease subunit R n=1 Tax=Lamprobacter modestohalophilus TaxID=1064514 RepID=UPI002ADEC57A|nr:type I restriction endonuclease subunit R [Lamprobacter modestohalophilus]MEA1048833.1 type I restriction endonuclease subunit R [Lamprobacter modestohalophilus]